MDRSARESVWEAVEPVIGVADGAPWSVDRHVALRVEYVVNQVTQSHRGQSEETIAQEIIGRLRALGVPPRSQRQVRQLAETISKLPNGLPNGPPA